MKIIKFIILILFIFGCKRNANDIVVGTSIFIHKSDSNYRFLYDCAIIEFKGKLFAAWYNCPEAEMEEASLIRGVISEDEGNTWSPVRTFINGNKWLYVPPAFGTDGERLYMFVSRMHGPDLVDDCEIFLYDEASRSFSKNSVFGAHFLPNTQAVRLVSGKWIIGGRVSNSADVRPGFPAIAVSETNNLGGKWRIVRISETDLAPNGKPFVCPETALIVDEDGLSVTAFVRSHAEEGQGGYMFKSRDEGETWSRSLPFPVSIEPVKTAAGRLSDGRRFIIGNPGGKGRSELAIWFAPKDDDKNDSTFNFNKKITIAAGDYENGMSPSYHYPSACEVNGQLHIVFTCNDNGNRAAAYTKMKL